MGCGSSSSIKPNDQQFHSPAYIENGGRPEDLNEKKSTKAEHEPEQIPNPLSFKLTRLTVPSYLAHLKSGNTLSTNGNLLVLQDGSGTIHVRAPPDFQPKKIPWGHGVLRDIVWSAGLNAFLLLSKNALYSLRHHPHEPFQLPAPNSESEFTISAYSTIKPYDEECSFWRCTCVQSTLYITYTGFGTVIDEYALKASSCQLTNRWTSPKTCASHEGIWCIRCHPETDQLGCAIVDATNNQWRLEVRTRENFACLWKINMPFVSGDCEISPCPNGEWLATNSFNVRLLQIGHQKLQAAVEYERELKNAIMINELYLVIRTKSTVEVHRLEQKK